MERGHMYFVVIMGWYSRMVFSWRISKTLDTEFCIEALTEAIGRYGAPEIFNTDQGAQFTSKELIDLLEAINFKISMDGLGRAQDNNY